MGLQLGRKGFQGGDDLIKRTSKAEVAFIAKRIAEEAEQPEAEEGWLAKSPQAPEPDLSQRPRKRAGRRTTAPASSSAVKRVKKIASKSDKPEVVRR